MAAPNYNGRSRYTIILLVLTTITLLTLDFRDFGPLNQAQAVVRTVLSPFRSAADTVFSPFGNGWKSLTEYDDIVAENEALRLELDELRGGAIRGQAAEATLEQVLGELDIDYLAAVRTVKGRVGDKAGNFDNSTITIGKGFNDGIEDGMPAVTAAGLVGRVVKSEADRADIELISDFDFGIGVRIIGPGDIALARGQGRGRDLLIEDGIDDTSVVEPGMLVVTSGIEGSPYPPDLPVGVVVNVEVDQAELQQRVSIRPASDLDRLSFITVILWNVEDVE